MFSRLVLAVLFALNSDQLAQRAIDALQAGKYAEAAAILERATAVNPNDPELWNLLGIADTECGKTQKAEAAFERGLRLAPDSVSLNENLGLLFFKASRYEQAKQRLVRAIQLGSDKPGVRFSLAASKLRTGETTAALAELNSLETALATRPDYWVDRGRAELLSDSQAAEKSFERALQLNPTDLAALNGAATASENQRLDEKALSYLIRARSAAPDDVDTLLHFANVCIRRDLGPDAISALEHARSVAPANSAVVYLLARAYISVQNWQRSFDLFSKYAAQHPRFAPTYYALGWLDRKLGRTEDARKQLERCLALDPNEADARYELAQLEFDDSHVEKARALLETVLRENPNHAKANMTLGEIMTRSGDLPRARELLERAVKDDPKLAAAHYKLSVVYAREHESEKAAQERGLAARLSAEEKQQSKTQLRLVLPGADASRRQE